MHDKVDKQIASMKIIITGSTGMIGKGVLLVCLDDPRVDQVLVINRSTVGIVTNYRSQRLLMGLP